MNKSYVDTKEITLWVNRYVDEFQAVRFPEATAAIIWAFGVPKGNFDREDDNLLHEFVRIPRTWQVAGNHRYCPLRKCRFPQKKGATFLNFHPFIDRCSMIFHDFP